MLLPAFRLRVPQTIAFNDALPYTQINGYRFHTEVYGEPESTPVLVVHGGPGQGFQYMKALQSLSGTYRVVFYDQRGAGLSPRVDTEQLTLQQNLDDLHTLVQHFSGGKKVKLIGHSWGGLLVVGYLSKHPEEVSQAVVIEPLFLYPGAPVKAWVKQFKQWTSAWKIAPYLIAYPFIIKEDGQEGYDYIATKIANDSEGPPYNCTGQRLPPHTFQRLGYKAYQCILQPVIKHPESFTQDQTEGLTNYRGELMLISSACSFMGTHYQETYHLSKLPSQTIHVKAQNMGHNLLTLDPGWSLQVIENFFKPS